MATTSTNKVKEEAADWVTRIQSGAVDPDNCGELRRWLADSEDNQRVFRRMLDVFSRTEVLAANSAVADTASRSTPELRGQFTWAAAASLLVAVAIGFWAISGTSQRIETNTGERILMTLEDGSSVHLNALSTLTVRFTDDARMATLSRGETVFAVNSEDPRPFIVTAGGLNVEVTGTAFQVTNYGADTSVSVLEGEVVVRASASGDGTPSRRGTGLSLRAGQQVVYENDALGSPQSVDFSRVAAWRDGWLYLDGQPLGELIARLNRQYDMRFQLEDEALAESRISVAVKLGRRESTVSDLERLLPLDFKDLPGNRSIVHVRR